MILMVFGSKYYQTDIYLFTGNKNYRTDLLTASVTFIPNYLYKKVVTGPQPIQCA